MGINAGIDYATISKVIRTLIETGERDFIIFPYGYIGRVTHDVLKNQHGIMPAYILDNILCKSNKDIYDLSFLSQIDQNKYILLFAVENPILIDSLRYKVYSIYNNRRIVEFFYRVQHIDARVPWLRRFAEFAYEKELQGNVAECGVFRGDFAKYINEFFYDRNLYLFDSFEGFTDRDIKADKIHSRYSSFYETIDFFQDTSLKLVLSKMVHPEKIVVKKGYVPDAFAGVEDIFCFVNLDMDLYAPMLEALRFFYPRMVKGGIIMLHDYYCGHLLAGVKDAVCEYEKEINKSLCKIPSEVSTSLIVVK